MFTPKVEILIAPELHFFSLKCANIVSSWGSAPDPAWGACSAPPDRLAVQGKGGDNRGGVGRGREEWEIEVKKNSNTASLLKPIPTPNNIGHLQKTNPPSDKPIYGPDGCHSTAQFYHRLNFTLCYNIFLDHSSIIRVRVRVRVRVRFRVRVWGLRFQGLC